MGIDIVFRIAGIGILVAVACQLLKQTGRDDIAMLTALAGLVIVLTMVIGLIATLSEMFEVRLNCIDESTETGTKRKWTLFH